MSLTKVKAAESAGAGRAAHSRCSLEQGLKQRKGDQCEDKQDCEEHKRAMLQPFTAADLDAIQQPVRGQVQDDSRRA